MKKPYSKPSVQELTPAQARAVLKADIAKGKKRLANDAKPPRAATTRAPTPRTPGGEATATSKVRANGKTGTKPAPSKYSTAHLRKLTKEMRVLSSTLTPKEVEDLGLAAILMVSQNMALGQPGVDQLKVRDTLFRLHLSIMAIVKRLLQRWKPTMAENQDMQLDVLGRIQDEFDALAAPPAPAGVQVWERDSKTIHEGDPTAAVCDNDQCQNKRCARHVSKWN